MPNHGYTNTPPLSSIVLSHLPFSLTLPLKAAADNAAHTIAFSESAATHLQTSPTEYAALDDNIHIVRDIAGNRNINGPNSYLWHKRFVSSIYNSESLEVASDMSDFESTSDVLKAESASGDLEVGSVSNVLEAESASDALETESDNDVLEAESDNDMLEAESVSDELEVESTSDVLEAETDSDVLEVESVSDELEVESTSDVLEAESDSDVLEVESVSDELEVESTSDVLEAESASDNLEAESASDKSIDLNSIGAFSRTSVVDTSSSIFQPLSSPSHSAEKPIVLEPFSESNAISVSNQEAVLPLESPSPLVISEVYEAPPITEALTSESATLINGIIGNSAVAEVEGDCETGMLRCTGDKKGFDTCLYGKWGTVRSCAQGTNCVAFGGNSIVCAFIS
ncbi:hypothetical protein COEREDRAFT_84391 [Coemansia reversa NRRL 1564]|uniref:Carbohydrate-binding module family 19 domain-containing protein n=1 Tax=Coemansia reversa (strain ATCC 12441 / NRRL 1564) TaxID=763665 RepID=A0A2G5BLA1_COERN|nr:hypothetical protein COEREDRAFT_84391 [Coemansia reversa NRRL 1564]|eukprot:PIA19783.1 hypothetical protein COEREDRAFT_84391 [Coemansia reversa NRRL 1564]